MQKPTVLSIAGQNIGFLGDREFAAALQPYRRFFSRRKPQAVFACAPGSCRCTAGTSFAGGVFSVRDGFSCASLDVSSGKGVFAYQQERLGTSLATLLRVVSGFMLVRAGNGILLHAAAIVHEGKAFIFAGPSGAGKSTVCRLSAGKTVISDEGVFLAKGPAGYAVRPVPSWGDYQDRVQPSAALPIAGIYRLIQDTQVRVQRLSPAQAAAALFSFPRALDGCVSHASVLAQFSDLARRVPCFNLHFCKDNTFWRHIPWN